MAPDISHILDHWEFEPGRTKARLIAGDDGREKLQVRLDLGMLQMEVDGRPDGKRPEGAESLLDLLVQREEASEGPLELDSEQLSELMREGVQFYNRYMALFTLGEFDRVARDTERNLRLFHFVAAHVESSRDRWVFDQYRPFVTMMNTRARAEKLLQAGTRRPALKVIDQGIEAILAFFRENDREEDLAECGELNFLRAWRNEMTKSGPSSASDRLEEQLALAVEQEDYEQAAHLRDQLRRLREGPTPPESRPPADPASPPAESFPPFQPPGEGDSLEWS